MLSEVILILSIVHIIIYVLFIEYKSLKFIQDVNYNNYEYLEFYKWFYIKNIYHLFFILSLFKENIYIYLLNIVIVYWGINNITKYKNIIKFKFTKRIIILLICFFAISIIFYKFLGLYLLILTLPLINSVSILINKIIDYLLNIKYYKEAKTKIEKIKPFVITVTGSSGKTSVKNIIFDLIKDNYISVKTKKSFNTLKGIEISINDIKDSYKGAYLVLEMGAKKRNDIKKICRLVKSDISIITNILPQHMKTFKNINNILEEKSNVVWSLKENGTVILNKDDSNLKALINKIKEKRRDINILTYSIEDENCDLYAFDIEYYINYTSFSIRYQDNLYKVRTKLLSKHSVYNIMCSILVALSVKIDIREIINKINHLDFIDNRLEYKKNNNLIILDDSYNSNINGFINAIDVLMLYKGKKYLISPGIVETNNEDINKKVALYLKDLDIDVLLIKNKNVKVYQNILKNNVSVFDSFKKAYEYVLKKSEKEEICVLIENDLTDNYFL